jgi:K+-sensing histidine kinase KdpD
MRTRVHQVLQSLLAGAVPIVIAQIWPGPDSAKPLAAYVYFLCIAVAARFFGAVPALVCTVTSTLMLYGPVLVPAQHPTNVQSARLVTFIVAAVVIVSVSYRKLVEAGREISAKRLYGLFDCVVEGIFSSIRAASASR